MTFFKTLKNALTAGITLGAAKAPAESAAEATPPAKSPEEAASQDNRLLTLDSYVKFDSEGNRSHEFELRYVAYGEKSKMTCSALHAGPSASPPTGPPNALTTSIDLEGRHVASALLVMDGKDGLAADGPFARELAQLRAASGSRVCEISDLRISRENKSRRALGAMFHIIYLYARQARQMKFIVAQVRFSQAHLLEKLLGFNIITTRGEHVLMSLDLDVMKREQRVWGGQKNEAVDPPYLLYPFFFPTKDESGLLFRVLEHLGT